MMTTNEIDELLSAWHDAWQQGDVPRLLDLVAEDAEFWTHGAAPVVGREALGAPLRGLFERFSSTQEFEERERIVSADLALLRGVEINTLVPRTGGETMVVRQRAFSVLRRLESGEWVFSRGMTNQEPEDSQQ